MANEIEPESRKKEIDRCFPVTRNPCDSNTTKALIVKIIVVILSLSYE